jgi:HAE1 family hydrophobic/amphiphilic exporter-1
MAKRYRSTLGDIGELKILTPRGGSLRVEEVVDQRVERTPVTITRQDQQRLVTVDFRAVGRPLGTVVGDVQPALERIDWPADFAWQVGGTAEDLQESFQWLGYALLVGLALVYMVMASQFESLRNPFIVFLTIPLSAIGVVWILFLTGTTVNLFSIIGVIVLVGIVINNSIVLIDYTNLLRQRGEPLLDATREAARIRFRPVLMTALTTILAMLPLALGIGAGAETWAPMARSVVGGLVAGTFSTLLVIPVLYVIFEERRGRRLKQADAK